MVNAHAILSETNFKSCPGVSVLQNSALQPRSCLLSLVGLFFQVCCFGQDVETPRGGHDDEKHQ